MPLTLTTKEVARGNNCCKLQERQIAGKSRLAAVETPLLLSRLHHYSISQLTTRVYRKHKATNMHINSRVHEN